MQQFDLGLNLSTKKTRKREFLEQMQQVVPWKDLVALVAPYAPEGRKGRPPFPVEMLLRTGTIVDATLIAAPSSTKNSTKSRDPEMHQTKKGNQWYFGMKAHIGVDADSGLVHTVRGTSANVNDVVEANSLLHGQEIDGYADAGYQGADKRPDMPEPTPERKFQWHIAMKRSQRKALDHQQPIPAMQEQLEQVKSKIRAKVEHPFRVIKQQFGHIKVRYRGLRNNTQQLHTLFALANLWMAHGRLLANS